MRTAVRSKKLNYAINISDNAASMSAFENLACLLYRTQQLIITGEDRQRNIKGVFALWIDGVPGMSPGDLVLYADGDVGADALYVVRKEEQYYIGNVQFKLDGGPVFLQKTLGGEPVRLGQLADTHIEGRVLGWMHVHR